MQNSEKRTALVTGGNRGIEFEIARELASRDITVLIGARNEEQGLKAQEQMRRDMLDAHFILLDVTQALSVKSAAGRIRDEFRRLDILVNNAGIMIDSKTGIAELNLTIFQNTLETNALGPLLLSQACLPLMKAHNYGCIVNMSRFVLSLCCRLPVRY